MSYSCRSILKQMNPQLVNETWRKCEDVLGHMSSFSQSARNSLRFLQVTHQHVVQNYTGEFPSFNTLWLLLWSGVIVNCANIFRSFPRR